MADRPDGIDELRALGFTETEARVYTFLVAGSPATAYRIAQGIGKTAASTYKAVEALQQKGAVLVDETASRICRAVPPEDLLSDLGKSFAHRQQRAARALERIPRAKDDEGVYALHSWDQILARGVSMLEHASTVVLIDAFPGILEEFRELLEGSASRGVRVVAHVYQATALRGVEVIEKVGGDMPLQRWPGQWLSLTADRAEVLFAYLGKDGRSVHHALWSPSVFLAWLQHSYLAYTLQAAKLERLITEGAPAADMEEAMRNMVPWLGAESRGQQEMRRRFREER